MKKQKKWTEKRLCVICKREYSPSAPNQKYCIYCRKKAKTLRTLKRSIKRNAESEIRQIDKVLGK